MLIFQKKGATRVLELYCLFIILGSMITFFLNYIYYYLFDKFVVIDYLYILNVISGTILLYFVPVYYYSKFDSINISFYFNYSLLLTILYIFTSVFMANLNGVDFDIIYLQKICFVIFFYINGSLFLTYYLIMFYSYLRKKVFSKRLIDYDVEKNEWFI